MIADVRGDAHDPDGTEVAMAVVASPVPAVGPVDRPPSGQAEHGHRGGQDEPDRRESVLDTVEVGPAHPPAHQRFAEIAGHHGRPQAAEHLFGPAGPSAAQAERPLPPEPRASTPEPRAAYPCRWHPGPPCRARP